VRGRDNNVRRRGYGRRVGVG